MTLRKTFICILLCGLCMSLPPAHAQDTFETYDDFQSALDEAIASGDFEPFWEQVVAQGAMPLIFDDTAVFMYRGEAEEVEWRGDFTGWDTDPAYQGERIGESDIWMLVQQFPMTARLDYKIVVDGNNWLMDALNTQQQWGGFGPNSMFAMPDYVPDTALIPRDDIEQGEFSDVNVLESEALGYGVGYRVYTPAGYDTLENLPVVYVTDGHEYADERLGTMITVLDNLIADGLIEPIIAVFVDPRDPESSGTNRREQEYIANEDFAAFLATELVPAIDAAYKTDLSPDARALLGTSLGGLNAAFVGLQYPDIFHLLAIQSPAFWVHPEILQDYEEADSMPFKIFMSQGSIWDDHENTLAMRDILESKGYDLQFVEVPEGHSWGNWRNLLDDLLIYFFAAE